MIFKIDSTIWFANENFDEKQNFNCVFIRALQSTATGVVSKQNCKGQVYIQFLFYNSQLRKIRYAIT